MENFDPDDIPDPEEERLVSLGYWPLKVSYTGRVAETFGYDLPNIPSGKILDMGCCDGLTSRELKGLYPNCHIIGLDYYFSYNWADNEKLSFIHADGYHAPFKPESFDAVFCMNNISLVLQSPKTKTVKIKKALFDLGILVKKDGYLLTSSCDSWRIFQRSSGNFKLIKPSAQSADSLELIESWLTGDGSEKHTIDFEGYLNLIKRKPK